MCRPRQRDYSGKEFAYLSSAAFGSLALILVVIYGISEDNGNPLIVFGEIALIFGIFSLLCLGIGCSKPITQRKTAIIVPKIIAREIVTRKIIIV